MSKTHVPVANLSKYVRARLRLESVKEERLDFRPEFFFHARGNKMVAQIVSNGGLNQRPRERKLASSQEGYCPVKKESRKNSLSPLGERSEVQGRDPC